MVELIAIVENFKVNQDSIAKIVINERTGTIVAGGELSLNPVAVSHENLTIQVGDEGSQGSLHLIDKKTTLKELVNALNAIGTTPEDLSINFSNP